MLWWFYITLFVLDVLFASVGVFIGYDPGAGLVASVVLSLWIWAVVCVAITIDGWLHEAHCAGALWRIAIAAGGPYAITYSFSHPDHWRGDLPPNNWPIPNVSPGR